MRNPTYSCAAHVGPKTTAVCLQQHLQGLRSPPGSSAILAADMVAEMNALGSKLEDLVDENRLLRSKAGLQDDEAVDLSDVKLIKVTVRTTHWCGT